MYTYTILTTEPSQSFSELHNRMPVILRTHADVSTWLDTRGNDALQHYNAITAPYTGEDLTWHPVTKAVSNPKYQKADCAQDMRKKGLAALFAKAGRSPAKKGTDDGGQAASGGLGKGNKAAGGGGVG